MAGSRADRTVTGWPACVCVEWRGGGSGGGRDRRHAQVGQRTSYTACSPPHCDNHKHTSRLYTFQPHLMYPRPSTFASRKAMESQWEREVARPAPATPHPRPNTFVCVRGGEAGGTCVGSVTRSWAGGAGGAGAAGLAVGGGRDGHLATWPRDRAACPRASALLCATTTLAGAAPPRQYRQLTSSMMSPRCRRLPRMPAYSGVLRGARPGRAGGRRAVGLRLCLCQGQGGGA